MDDSELGQLLKDTESDRVERKASLSDKEKICEAICAFANDLPNHKQPGLVFVGVNDDGSCANLLITNELLLTLAHIRSDGNVLPLPSMTVQKRIVNACETAVVKVEPSDAPPVRYKGRVWIRVGPRRAIATLGVQRFGIGIQLARQELSKNANPEPKFTVEDTHVLALIRSRT